MRVGLVAALLSICLPALAHDFWIEPSTFHPAVGQTVMLALRVGQNFDGDPVPRSAQLMASFEAHEGGGQHRIDGYENQDPAGWLKIERSGVALVAYRSNANFVELPPEKFAEFLKTEGIDSIRPDKADREHFFRYAKTLLRSGTATTIPIGHIKDFRYDLVLESNPWSGPLRVRVFFENRPARGVLVTAIHREDASRISARTDISGRATLDLAKPGVWLIKSTTMVAAPKDSGVDWESLWASVTLER
jgi:Domain of unknown function (DUF4198)